MSKPAATLANFMMICLSTTALMGQASAQAVMDVPGPPRAALPEPMPRMPMRQMSDAQREESRQRREAWRQMSPEDRHQLRSDIRAAGQTLYPRGHRHRLD